MSPPDVTVDGGVDGKLSQETREMTTGSSLISLQPYRAPCPHYKCHLSPRDWDRKPSRTSRHKHRSGILQKPVSLFWGFIWGRGGRFFSLSFSSSISSSTHTHMHMGTHTHVHSESASISEGLHSTRTAAPNNSRDQSRLLDFFFAFQENWGTSAWFLFPILPFSKCLKAQRKHILPSENTLLCIRQ